MKGWRKLQDLFTGYVLLLEQALEKIKKEFGSLKYKELKLKEFKEDEKQNKIVSKSQVLF